MSRKSIAMATALGLAIALFAAAGLAFAAPAPGYDELLPQAKQDRPGVDFRALRYAYADGDAYDPYDPKEGELRAPLVKAFADKDCGNAIKHAQAILDWNYIYIDAHMVMDVCYRRLNQPQLAKHHGLMAHGLIDSILTSGDGKTPKSAFVVISVPEEYSIMNVLGQKKVRQALKQVEGHRYDQINVQTKAGGTDIVYFNIDRLYAGWKRKNVTH